MAIIDNYSAAIAHLKEDIKQLKQQYKIRMEKLGEVLGCTPKYEDILSEIAMLMKQTDIPVEAWICRTHKAGQQVTWSSLQAQKWKDEGHTVDRLINNAEES